MPELSSNAKARHREFKRTYNFRRSKAVDALHELWAYALEDRVFLRREGNSFHFRVEDQEKQVSIPRIRGWSQRGWIEMDYRLDGNDQIADLTLTEAGMVVLWGDC